MKTLLRIGIFLLKLEARAALRRGDFYAFRESQWAKRALVAEQRVRELNERVKSSDQFKHQNATYDYGRSLR